MPIKILNNLKDQLQNLNSKIEELESILDFSNLDQVVIEKSDLGKIKVINEDRGYIIFKFKECSFVQKINSIIHKGLLEGTLDIIVLKKIETPQTYNYNYIVTHRVLNTTEAAIIKNYS